MGEIVLDALISSFIQFSPDSDNIRLVGAHFKVNEFEQKPVG